MITVGWRDGRAILFITSTTISLSRAEAEFLAQDLADGKNPACTGYPLPSSTYIGEYVISEVTRVAGDHTVVQVSRVIEDGHRYVASMTLTADQRDALVAELKNGGNA